MVLWRFISKFKAESFFFLQKHFIFLQVQLCWNWRETISSCFTRSKSINMQRCAEPVHRGQAAGREERPSISWPSVRRSLHHLQAKHAALGGNTAARRRFPPLRLSNGFFPLCVRVFPSTPHGADGSAAAVQTSRYFLPATITLPHSASTSCWWR